MKTSSWDCSGPAITDAVDGRVHSYLTRRLGHIICRYGLEEGRGHAHGVAVCGILSDGFDELVELRRMDDRVRYR